MMEKGLKDIHVTSLLLTMSMRGIAEEENLPTGASRAGFDYFQHVAVSSGLIEGFPDDSGVKNLLPMQEMKVQSLGWEEPLEKEMATHFSILAQEIPWTEEPGGL